MLLPVPALKGDKPRTVTCKPSEALKAFVKTLVKRAELLKTTRIDPRVDNMLRSPARAARPRWTCGWCSRARRG
jgi:hypothetical protein